MDEDRSAWRLLQYIGRDAGQRRQAGEADKDLPRWGERLQRAEALFAQSRFRPTETERRFVAAARALDERERRGNAERAAARIDALEHAAFEQRRKTRIALAGATVTALLLAVALWLWTASEQARQDADQARLTAEPPGPRGLAAGRDQSPDRCDECARH